MKKPYYPKRIYVTLTPGDIDRLTEYAEQIASPDTREVAADIIRAFLDANNGHAQKDGDDND